jgi:hypothetical protein
MADSPGAAPAVRTADGRWLTRLVGPVRLAYLPVLITYFAYGASAVTAIGATFFAKNALRLQPAEVAEIAFWLGLPWAMKMVAGVASDVYPVFGSRRVSYLILGALCSLVGYGLLATVVATKGGYLAAMLVVTVGFMIQDVVADALSVEIAESEEEMAQVQALGRMALLMGSISVGYLSGWLAGKIGPRGVFAAATVLPALVIIGSFFVRPGARARAAAQGALRATSDDGPLSGGRARLVFLGGLGYAAFGVLLKASGTPFAQELILAVSGGLIVLLLQRVGISRAVAVAAFAIFLFRAVPGVGPGYTYWAIDRLSFDEEFLGRLAQASSILSLAGLIAFRKPITRRPVSFTLFWVTVVGSLLTLPSIGLFYGANEWVGVSARTWAFIDTTISAPLAQLSMVPMLTLIARTAPRGAEATVFAIMASLMNLALSASELFTRYLNTYFAVTQQDYSSLGVLMITVGVLGLVPLLAIPMLKRAEAEPPARAGAAVAAAPTGGSAL